MWRGSTSVLKMKTKGAEQDAPTQLSSVKKSKRRRGKKKARPTVPEGAEAHGDEEIPSQPGDVTAQVVDVTSQSDGFTSQFTEKSPETFACEACDIQMKNSAQLSAHLNSKRHARRRRELRILAALADTTQVTEVTDKEALAARLAKGNTRLQPVPLKEGELPDCITRRCEGKVRQKVSYTCDLCTVQLTSLVKVQEHLVSQRHTALQEGRPDPTLDGQHPASKTRRKASVKNSWFW
ncbi:uncharacterized protein LOC122391327 isoform X3 [Amphibalanus amphitrite]|uniref:uncharacterized protein LOC122391327 isoform X2 n=1 Tax=Amphibalanus amphitrite TaxID=1232801 RepID=UPI001C926FA3|nr:uncharacterized protein LOC122391327 isoform X2 [Amphibalanus amphitrite]XP_043241061.1 uncharacterized protein LOC122391327 isoform X3 [Amphibalanus amphitrite]